MDFVSANRGKKPDEQTGLFEREKALILNSIDDLVVYHDPEMNILWANRAAEVSVNCASGDLVGRYCWEIWHQRNKPCVGCPVISALNTGETQMAEIISPDGKEWFIRGYPIKNDDGTIKGAVELCQDITGRKLLEKERELLIKQLEVEQKRLQEAKDQVELYLDLMGHDINNMHQVALGYLEMARDMSPHSDSRLEFLDRPYEVLQRSARLIDNVRKLQKLKDGVFRTETVDLCKVLEDVTREYTDVPNKAVTLNCNGNEHCFVLANELLHDLFSNLVSNAIKHSDGEQANIIIDLDRVQENGSQYYRVMVEDNGPGIPDDFKEKIFNRLLRGTTKSKGMGLGLYLVKSLTDSYNGKVRVEDRIIGDHTKGARFVVMLPAIFK